MRLFGKKTSVDAGQSNDIPIDPEQAAIEYAIQQANYYREDASRKNFIILGMVVLALIEGVVIYAKSAQAKPEDHYFAVGPDLEVIALKPEKRAVLNDQQVVSWLGKNVEELFTYSFFDYTTHWRLMASRSMTIEAATDLDAQLEASGIKRAVMDLNLSSKAVAVSAPIVTHTGIIQGNRAWELSVDGVVNYAGPTKTSSQPVTWAVLVMELPQANGRLRITKIQMKNRQVLTGG